MNAIQAKSVTHLLNSTSIYWIGLGVAFVIMAVVVHRLRVWYWDRDDPADQKDEIIHQMKELKLRGDLSEEEFRSIKGQLEGQKNSGSHRNV